MTMGGSDPPRPDDTGPVEFVASMRKLRRWSGLTFRELAIEAQAFGALSVAHWVAARDRVAAQTGETSQDSDAEATPSARPVAGSAPAMLPPDIPDFTGRTAEVAALLRMLGDASPAKGSPTALTVVAVVGMGGVGKTALAVHAAHLLAGSWVTGDDRVDTRRSAAAEIVGLCGGLPLAVRIAGARLAARLGWQLEHLATMLSDERRRLDRLATGDLAVRTSLALSYQALDEQPRRLFRLLGLSGFGARPPPAGA